MSVSVIRAQIKSELQSITNVKNVHDYKRRVNEWSKIESEFKATDKIHTWIIKWMGSTFEFDMSIEGYDAIRPFQIWGLYSLNDANASEKAFDDIAEEVEDHFAKLRVLNNKGRMKIEDITTTMDEFTFAGILCNRCILTLDIKESQEYA